MLSQSQYGASTNSAILGTVGGGSVGSPIHTSSPAPQGAGSLPRPHSFIGSHQGGAGRRGPLRTVMGVMGVLVVMLFFIFGTIKLDAGGKFTSPSERQLIDQLTLNGQLRAPNSGRKLSAAEKAEAMRKELGLGLANDSPEAAEAFLAGERERLRLTKLNKKQSRKANLKLSKSVSMSSSLGWGQLNTSSTMGGATAQQQQQQQAPCIPNATHPCPVRIDLVMYVLFQRELNGHLLGGINWHWIPRLDSDMGAASVIAKDNDGDGIPDEDEKEEATQAAVMGGEGGDDDAVSQPTTVAPEGNGAQPQPVSNKAPAPKILKYAGDQLSGDNTEAIVNHMVSESHERDRTRFAFVAVNPHVAKNIRLLPSQLRSSLRKRIFGSSGRAKNALAREIEAGRVIVRPGSSGTTVGNGGGGATLPKSSSVTNHPPTLSFTSHLVAIKGAHVPKTVLAGRVLKEWRMPGYSRDLGFGGEDPHRTGAPMGAGGATNNTRLITSPNAVEQRNAIFHHMEEFGTMRTLYHSGLTFLHSNNAGVLLGQVNASSKHRRQLAADADGDGVQEWMGVFPADMRIELKHIQLIRRRIRQGTWRYLGGNVSVIQQQQAAVSQQAKKKKRSGALFRGRVVGGAVVNSDSVNKPKTMPPLPDAYAPKIALPANHHCCIFYSGSYPSVYLFNNALSQQLLTLHNAFFAQSVPFSQLVSPTAKDAILEAFVLPNALFNKLFPFVDHVIHMLVVDGVTFPSPSIGPSVAAGEGSGSDAADDSVAGEEMPLGVPTIATPTEVLERALAMALALEPRWLRIRLPVRHARDF